MRTLCCLVMLAILPALPARPQGPDMSKMTTYYVVFLKKGPKWTTDRTPEVEKLQMQHLAHIRGLAKSGKLILAGPFTAPGDMLGMAVFAVASADEARELEGADPAVKAGRLTMEILPWMSVKGITSPEW